jgi:hypothetical protein
VCNMVSCLCDRLTHQPGRSDREIKAREMVHGNASADTMTRLSDQVCDGPPELDFGRGVGFVSALIFEPLNLQTVARSIRKPASDYETGDTFRCLS